MSQRNKNARRAPTICAARKGGTSVGRIPAKVRDFWARKSDEWHAEEQRICAEMLTLEKMKPERLLDGARILELAHKAYFLYLKQTPEEQAKLLKIVVSNCSIDAVNVYPIYRKPFDLIFAQGKNEGWRAQGDDFRTFLADLVSCLP
jgi:hypothetical protein